MNWYSKYAALYETPFNDVPDKTIKSIKEKIESIQSTNPFITISIIAYNEENRLTSCIWSLSEMKCKYPVKIIGVDNNSSDNTKNVFESLGVPCYIEKNQSPGHARNRGLKEAEGFYFVNIDADTIYPEYYVQTMIDKMIKDKSIASYGLWSFMPHGSQKISLYFYELIRDIYLLFLSINRPELCVRGMVFAHETAIAQKIGFRNHIKRGEDGALASELKNHGKLSFVRNKKARPITGHGTLSKDGSLLRSFTIRVLKNLKGILRLFTKKKVYIDGEDNLINNK